MTQDNKDKQDFLNTMLAQGDAMVCIDARQPDVEVPKAHKTNPMLNLVLSLNFRRPFEVLEDGVYGSLSFGGRPYKCVIPFTAVWAIYEPDTQKGQVWETSIPDDIDWGDKKGAITDAPPPGKPAAKPAMKTVAGSGKSEKPKRDRSHLRVIK
ncbi:MAG: ClpXP protease specificity-enhancing factor SspB [Nitrospinota bacterium]|nr:ClpXP protease specificity-enhancing factor SspB [Nitrospinota bacterium]